MKLRICHLYPDLLNLYGDRGNILILAQRARWRGWEVEVDYRSLGERIDPFAYDLIFLGGGPDQEQGVVSEDLKIKGPLLLEAAEAGVAILSICGGYQLLGHFYRSARGEVFPGVGLFPVYTEAGAKRLRGNIAVELGFLPGGAPVVGFENHSGRTYLEGGEPLGRVLYGYGNNGLDGTEGVRYRRALGTYLHGPLLAKNPHLADYILKLALERRHGQVELEPLDDALEMTVNRQVYLRFGRKNFLKFRRPRSSSPNKPAFSLR
ncbi:MAG: hypothetical protein PWP65_231 [Clostridia bacterium]|nr:hypothetical protein [Clostridia bacterium]